MLPKTTIQGPDPQDRRIGGAAYLKRAWAPYTKGTMREAAAWAAERDDLLDYALRLAEDSALVFPCGPDKKPLLISGDNPDAPLNDRGKPSGGFPAASRLRERVSFFFSKVLDRARKSGILPKGVAPMIGIPCALNGVFVLDIDVPGQTHPDAADGRLWLKDLEDRHGPLPETVRVKTGSGGLHIYFLLPEDYDGHENYFSGKCGGGEIKVNGYVIAPWSRNEHGGLYELLSPPGTFVAEPPEWLLQELGYKRKAPSPELPMEQEPATPGSSTPPATRNKTAARSRGEAWAAEALRLECDAVRTAPEGGDKSRGLDGRDKQLYKSAFKMGQRSKYLDEGTAKAELLAAAKGNKNPLPLSDDKLRDKINRAWSVGVTRPKEPLDRDDGADIDFTLFLERELAKKAKRAADSAQKENGRQCDSETGEVLDDAAAGSSQDVEEEQEQEEPAAPEEEPDDTPELPKELTPEEEASMLAEVAARKTEREEEARETAEEDKGPEPLFLDAAPEPPLDVFPEAVRTMLTEAAQTYKCPIQIPTAAFLALLSSCVECRRVLRAKDGFTQAGNLWIVIVGVSGVGKSHVSDAIFSRLNDRQAEKHFEYKNEWTKWRDDFSEWEKRREKGEKSPQPPRPKEEAYTLEDVTPEVIADVLQDNPAGIMLKADELPTIFSMDRYRQAKDAGTSQARFLSSYDCGPWEVRRVRGGRNRYVKRACIGMFATVQPRKLEKMFSQIDEEAGFTPRFTFIRSDVREDDLAIWTESTLSRESRELLERITDRLLALDMIPGKLPRALAEKATSDLSLAEEELRLPDEPITVSLTQEAKAAYVAFYERTGASAYDDYTRDLPISWKQKLKGQCLRVCLLLHCLQEVLTPGHEKARSSVPRSTMEGAVRLTEWIAANQWQLRKILSGKAAKVRSKTVEEAALIEAVKEAAGTSVLASPDDRIEIATSELSRRVNALLAPRKLSPESIGRIASSLGFKASRTGSRRSRFIAVKDFLAML